MEDYDAGYADGQCVPVVNVPVDEEMADHLATDELLAEFCAEFPHLPRAEAAEVLHWLAERGGRVGRPAAREAVRFKVSLLDLFDVLLGFPRRSAHQGIRQLLWVLEDERVDDLLNHESPGHWFRRYGLSKYMCYKGAEAIRQKLGLPLRKDQRPREARENMTKSRKGGMETDLTGNKI